METYDPATDPIRRLKDGTPLTPEKLAELERRAAALDPDTLTQSKRGPGRPSLGDTGESAQLRVRVPAGLHHDIKVIAKARNVSVSVVTRDLLEDALTRIGK